MQQAVCLETDIPEKTRAEHHHFLSGTSSTPISLNPFALHLPSLFSMCSALGEQVSQHIKLSLLNFHCPCDALPLGLPLCCCLLLKNHYSFFTN